ncbi:MAG TPA: hypothetical protein VNA25_02925 [Phycisphaerae bacterium]|nr:hypothetical protein [Phycisphaerae bacterium]
MSKLSTIQDKIRTVLENAKTGALRLDDPELKELGEWLQEEGDALVMLGEGD